MPQSLQRPVLRPLPQRQPGTGSYLQQYLLKRRQGGLSGESCKCNRTQTVKHLPPPHILQAGVASPLPLFHLPHLFSLTPYPSFPHHFPHHPPLPSAHTGVGQRCTAQQHTHSAAKDGRHSGKYSRFLRAVCHLFSSTGPTHHISHTSSIRDSHSYIGIATDCISVVGCCVFRL